MKKDRKFTKKAFVEWVQSLKINRSFEYLSNYDCVVARFLIEKLEHERLNVVVHSRSYSLINEERKVFKEYPIPKFVLDVMNDIRLMPKYHGWLTARNLKKTVAKHFN